LIKVPVTTTSSTALSSAAVAGNAAVSDNATPANS
jgi:hypothetical protein